MTFDIVTIFPDFFSGPFTHGVLRRAIETGTVKIATHDLRSFTHDRHRTVDDRPFGGGEGMVLKPEPIFDCIASLGLAPKTTRDRSRESVVLLSAQGRPFTQAIAAELATLERIVFICGRYEGVDERVNQLLCDREISIGDYVLSGGELAAAVVVDAIVRLLPGVLGNPDSTRFESFGASENPAGSENPATQDLPTLPPSGKPPSSTSVPGGLLDYPHYTRPANFRGESIPDVLAGGDHLQIQSWRRERALEKTFLSRPDLLEHAELSSADRKFLAQLNAAQQQSLLPSK